MTFGPCPNVELNTLEITKYAIVPHASNAEPVTDEWTYLWTPPKWQITDDAQQIVEGYASLPNLDDQGDIVPIDVITAAMPDYMVWGNLREMHERNAIGKVEGARVDDKGVWIKAKIVDPLSWSKVKSGVLQGFSIGGRPVTTETRADGVRVITKLELGEISLVDRPANPEARIMIAKILHDREREPVAVAYAGAKCAKHGRQYCPECWGSQISKNKPLKSMDLEKVKAQLSDPQDIEVAEQFEKILERNGIAKDNWHDQTKPKEPTDGLEIDDDDNTAEFLKTAEEDGEPEPDADDEPPPKKPPTEKAGGGGGWQTHFKTGSKHLSACHKAIGEGNDEAKGHAMKAMKSFSKMAKCFGNSEKAWSEKVSRISKAYNGNGQNVFVTETDFEKACIIFTNQIKKAFSKINELEDYVGTIPVPKLRPAMPVNRDDEQSNTLTATRNSFGR